MSVLLWITAVVCAFGLGVGFANTVKAFIAKVTGQAEDAVKAEAVKVETEVKNKL